MIFWHLKNLNGGGEAGFLRLVIPEIGKYFTWEHASHVQANHLLYLILSVQFSSVQSLSRVWLFATPWIAARQASLSITNFTH